MFNKSKMKICVEKCTEKESNEKYTLAKDIPMQASGGFLVVLFFFFFNGKKCYITHHVLNIMTSLYFLVKTLPI